MDHTKGAKIVLTNGKYVNRQLVRKQERSENDRISIEIRIYARCGKVNNFTIEGKAVKFQAVKLAVKEILFEI